MSIEQAYERNGEPIISPDLMYQKIEKITDVCVVCFSYKALHYVLDHHKWVRHYEFHASANGPIDVYYLSEFNVLFFMSPIGSAIAGALLHEFSFVSGVTKFIYFGSCGILDESLKGSYIIPTSVYREDGYSYHYAPPSDYIDIKNHEVVAKFFDENKIPHAKGKGWTTDAIFNETKKKFADRKQEGVVCVDMEAAGLQAISNHLGVDLYIFFFAGDILGESWQVGHLGGEKERVCQVSCVDIALKLGKSLQ